jgi:hypothetical protein
MPLPEAFGIIFSIILVYRLHMPSSVIDKISYFQESHTLRVEFVSGLIYDYHDVPPEVYKSLKIAGSKGRFLNFHIKGKFRFDRVN